MITLGRETRLKMMRAAVAVAAAVLAAAAGDDVVQVPWRAGSAPLNATTWSGVVRSTKRSFTGHVGILDDSSLFSIELPPNGCVDHVPVSVSASLFGCELAVK